MSELEKETNMRQRQSFLRYWIVFSLTLIFLVSSLQQAEADSSVVVKNETGYDLSEIKYVKEIGKVKSLVGQARQITNGGSYKFVLKNEGFYRVYASLVMGGKKVYAKGNANNLQDGGRYTLTLTKVVISKEGSNLNFIDQSEFDAIK
jgi:hypothetical protein